MLLRIAFICVFRFITVCGSSDFENAKVIGLPNVQCSKKSISIKFESNIPFQGRISVINKLYIPECNQDYSSNIQKNASFSINIEKCTDPTFLKNGSRVLSAHVEIGFHPLVITSNDRIYMVECVDTISTQIPTTQTENANCTHVIRMASRWESATEFHVGDAIVHEWTCQLPHKELGKTQVFITNCNALSQNGQVIHLIDENGCIIDSELMGEVVYNSYMPKLYARARIFKLLTDEKYRIECTVEFCHRDSPCKERAFPPKCAFTREEIIRRFTSNTIDNELNSAMMPGNPNIGYDKRIKVSTDWLTVRYNQYTKIGALHERYQLKTFMDATLLEEKSAAVNHFLMGISYRDPQTTTAESQTRSENNRIEAASIHHPSGIQAVLSPPIASNEEFIESITIGNTNLAEDTEKLFISKTHEYKPFNAKSLDDKIIENSTSKSTSTSTSSKPRTTTTPSPPTTTKSTKSTTKSLEKPKSVTPTKSSKSHKKLSTVTNSTTSVDPPMTTNNPAARLQFYTDITTRKLTPTTPYTDYKSTSTISPETTQEHPFQEGRKHHHYQQQSGNSKISYDKFVSNNADWRLDDRAINDSDVLPEKQIGPCANATIISTNQQCKWTGVEHLLLIWSFSSLIVWMVLIAICFYRHSSRKPRWMAFREQELRRAAQSRVLSQEHPWLHADAFEERNRSKTEIEINKF